MTTDEITEMQRRIGTTSDGFWGPKSIATCQKHLRSLMPRPNPWPKADQRSLTGFYGQPGDERQLTNLDVYDLGLEYSAKRIRTVRVNQACAESLRRVLVAIAESEHHDILKLYAGVYNNRPMRGGSLPSLHARGAAIDLDPGTNGLHTPWPTRATMPLGVMECFAREGWLAAGAFWGRDAMHFQATL
jgi:hypothetical protein